MTSNETRLPRRDSVRRAAALEAAMWASLFHWIARRPMSRDPHPHYAGYSRAVTPLIGVFIALSAIELTGLHFLLPWTGVRVVVDILSAWGLLWMIGMLAAAKVHPHVISDAGIVVRHGLTVAIEIPWDHVESASASLRTSAGSRTLQLTPLGATAALNVVVTGQTTVTIRLRTPLPVTVKDQSAEVTEIRCYADDPGAMVAAIRAML